MSREALSLEISQAVSRVVGGEPIDADEQAVLLALKYPDLGMSAEMISEAITRAANMVGMIKSAPMPVAWPDEPVTDELAAVPQTNGGNGDSTPIALPGLAQSIEEDLASAIDSEIGSLLSNRTATEADAETNGQAQAEPAQAAVETPRRLSPVAALRRALFRH